jgi:hypothetical protein
LESGNEANEPIALLVKEDCPMTVASEKTKRATKPAMGTVDLLLGLIAAVSKQLCEERKAPSAQIAVGDLYDAIRALQTDARFESDFKHLDFTRVGANWYSEALDEFLFQAGTWGLHKVPNPAISSISLERERAEKRLQTLRREFGSTAVDRLENEIACAFIVHLKKMERNTTPNGVAGKGPEDVRRASVK